MSKKWIPTEQQINQIEEWVGEGLTESSIAIALGIKPNTLTLKKHEFPEIAEAVNRGKLNDEALCTNRLRKLAFDDNFKSHLTALMFYGKIRFGWNDKPGQTVKPLLPKGIKFSRSSESEDSEQMDN